MRLSINAGSTRVGNVEIHEAFRVIELDAGHFVETKKPNGIALSGHGKIAFSQASLHAVEIELAIVILCMNEDRNVLDGVLHGVPHDCLIILVSNSEESNFQAECRLLKDFCENAQRLGIVVHQRDEGLAHAFHAAGLSSLVEPSAAHGAFRVRNGKGEGMMIGTALTKLAQKKFVGFIDADNFIAGSIHEYCKAYAAGLHYTLHCTEQTNPLAMTRIKWNSKPKVKDNELVFEKSGRSSRVVNKWMNLMQNALVGGNIDDEIIQTANAGEHAMSTDLAMELQFASGYAVEPFQLVNAWEQFGAHKSGRKIHILQIETRNPHFHDCGKGDDHIQRMQAGGLSTIYHSNLAPQELKDELREYCKENLAAVVEADGELKSNQVYPPLQTMGFEVFRAAVSTQAQTLKVFGSREGGLFL